MFHWSLALLLVHSLAIFSGLRYNRMFVCVCREKQRLWYFPALWITTAESLVSYSKKGLYLGLKLLKESLSPGSHEYYFRHQVHTVNYRKQKQTCNSSTSVLATCWLSLFGFYPPLFSSRSISASFLISHQKCKLFICVGLKPFH